MTQEEISAYKSEVFGNNQSPVQNQTPVPSTEPAPEPAQQAAAEPTVEPTIETPPEVTAPETKEEVIDAVTYLKEQLGYDDWEVAKNEISELRKLKETPPTPAEIKFANEQSKKVHEYLKEGKEDEVAEYFAAKRVLKDVESKSDDEKLKLYIKLQNPLFSDKHAEEEYQETYTLNEDEIDPSKLERMQLKLAQKKQEDIAKANQYFEQYKAKLELPEIQPKSVVPQANDEIEQYKQSVELSNKLNAVWNETLSKLNPEKFVIKQSFNDEANKIKFDAQFVPDKAGAERARQAAQNYSQFLTDNYYQKDGTPLAEKLVEDIYFLQNREKYTAEIMKQAVNATMVSFLKNQKNIGDNVPRNYTTVPETDIQKLKKAIF